MSKDKGLTLILGITIDDSLLSLLLYEGILRLLRGSPAKYSFGELIFDRNDTIQNSFRIFKLDTGERWSELINHLNQITTDINSWPSIARYFNRIGVDCQKFLDEYLDYCLSKNEKKKGNKCEKIGHKIKAYCESVNFKPKDKSNMPMVPLGLIFKHTYEAFNSSDISFGNNVINLRPVFVSKRGRKRIFIDINSTDKIDEKEFISFGLLKTDRYTGLNLLESNSLKEQVTLYVSWRAFTIFLIGIAGSYVSGGYFDKRQSEHLMLFYKPEYLSNYLIMKSDIIEPGQVTWLIQGKNIATNSLKEIYNYSNMPEILSLGIYALPKLRDLLSSTEDLNMMAFNILVLKMERMFKRYSGWPVEISREDPLEKVVQIIGSTISEKTSFKKAVSDSVTCPKSPLLQGIGRWMSMREPDSHKALNSLIQLYRFYMTGSPSYFYDYVRSMYEAMEKCESSEDARGCRWRAVQYRKLLLCMGWIGSDKCSGKLQLCDQ